MRNTQINNALALSLSGERLTKYLLAAGSDLDLAIGLYERNTRLAEAFYTPLQAMEICFRNQLDRQMADMFGTDWMTNGKPPLLKSSADGIQGAIEGLEQSGVPITSGAIVAELNFWFWVGLLGPRYDATIWRQGCHRAFRATGRGMSRNLVHGRFNALRRFRNRVAHHEPIFHDDLESRHEEIMEALRWMCSDTAAWAAHHSRFPAVFAGP